MKKGKISTLLVSQSLFSIILLRLISNYQINSESNLHMSVKWIESKYAPVMSLTIQGNYCPVESWETLISCKRPY